MTASVSFAGSNYVNRPARELVHCMAALCVGPGDSVACPIEGIAQAPVLDRDPFRSGRVLAAVNGHALVKVGDGFAWFRQGQLRLLRPGA